MKRILITIFAALLISSAFSQETNIIYKVTNYSINGENFDDLALESDVALAFYECDSGVICFTNMWRNDNTQSYGSVHALQRRETPETSTEFATIEYKFTWNFVNSYDDITGKAAVTVTNIFIGNTVKFTAEIVVLDTNEVLLFKGYLEN